MGERGLASAGLGTSDGLLRTKFINLRSPQTLGKFLDNIWKFFSPQKWF